MLTSLVNGVSGFESADHLIEGFKPHPEQKSCGPDSSLGFRRISPEGFPNEGKTTAWNSMKYWIDHISFDQYIRSKSNQGQVSPKRLLMGFDLKGLLEKPCSTEQVKLASFVQYFLGTVKLVLTECGPGPSGRSMYCLLGISTPLSWNVTLRYCEDSCVTSHWRTTLCPFCRSGKALLISTCGTVSAGPGW